MRNAEKATKSMLARANPVVPSPQRRRQEPGRVMRLRKRRSDTGRQDARMRVVRVPGGFAYLEE